MFMFGVLRTDSGVQETGWIEAGPRSVARRRWLAERVVECRCRDSRNVAIGDHNADPALDDVLIGRGAHPERTGWWAGTVPPDDTNGNLIIPHRTTPAR